MTDLAELRDRFAGQALAGAIAHRGADNIDEDTAAAWCYRMADAMLAARGEKQPEALPAPAVTEPVPPCEKCGERRDGCWRGDCPNLLF